MANNARENWLKQVQSRQPAEIKPQESKRDNWLKQVQSRKPVETAKKPAPVVPSVYKSTTWSPTVSMAARNAAMADVNAIFAEKQKQEQQAQQERQTQQETLQQLQKERAEMELTQTRANRSGGVKDKEAQKTLKAREKELEAAIQKGQEALGQQTTAERLGKAGQSIALNTAGSVPLIAETAEQALENTVAYENSELNQKIENALNDVKLAKAVHGEDSREYQMASGYLEHLRNEAMGYKKTQPGISKEGMGYQMLDMGQKLQEKALEGTTGATRFLGEAALSIADNAAMLPLALVNPALPAVAMGVKATAGRTKELTDQGVNASAALTRGVVSGAIEAATEKMGVDNLFDVVRTGGKGALVNILKQAGVEGTEEGFSYLFNWMADELAKDPNATFSPAELLASIAGGAFSGLVFGAGGTMVNRLGGGKAETLPTYKAGDVLTQKGKALQAPAEGSLHLQQTQTVDTEALYQRAVELDGQIKTLEDALELAEAKAMLSDAETGEEDKARVTALQRRLQKAQAEFDKVVSKFEKATTAQPKANTAERVTNANKNVNTIPQNVIEGGKLNAGADLSDAQQQRSNGAGAGEQAGSLGAGAAGNAAQPQTDTGGRAKEARDLADALQVAPQNSRSLGLVRGTEDNTVRMIPRDQQTEYMTEVANRVRQETGKEVDFFVGELRVKSSNARGYTISNGCIMPDGRIYVRADSEEWTAEQIAMHEAAHDLIANNDGMMAQTIQQVQERYGNEALEAMVDDYLRNLRGLDMDANSCMEEILCDAFAGINAFDAQADVLQEDVQRSFTEYRNKGAQQEQGAVSQRGPPAQQTTEAERPRAAETATRTRETNVTRDEETSETERPAETLSAAEKAKRELLDALNAGEITEEDFDAAWADIMSEPEMQDRERLSVTEQDERVREQTERYQRGEISMDELRGYLNGMQAGQANKNTTREGGVYVADKIRPGMSDADRARVLQKKTITAPAYDGDNAVNIKTIDQLKNKRLTEAKNILRTLAEKCGVFQSDYYNADVELEFTYSKSSFNESVQKQSERHENMVDFGKMLTVLPEICSGAVEVEAHTDKYTGTKRADANLKELHVLLGAFAENGHVVPVQLEIKEYKKTAKKDHKLYVTVTVNNKKAGIETLATHGVSTTASKSATPASEISVADIVKNVNPQNGDLLRYLPDDMLTQAQIESKQAAQTKENRRLNDMRYEYAVEKGYDDRAREQLDAKAEEQKYDSWSEENRKRPGEVTFGDDGKLIPLSERFDRSNPDERYSVTEETETAEEDIGQIRLETVAEEEHRKMLDGLTTKERNYLQRVERRAVNQIAKALGVPYHAKREYLMPMVQELATEYMTAGEISEGTKTAVFEKAWDEGIEADNEFYNAYKPLKDRLRNTAVMLAEQDRADIPDWNNARKNMFGVLRIVNQGGMTVDQFYEELASDYPGMFPTDIRHPADRLQRMYEVGRDIRIANLGLEQYYGPNAERYKAFARGEFENNLGEVLAEMRNVKRSAAERAEREKIKVPETPKEIMELYKTMKTSKREYEKVNAKQLLSDTDRELLNRAMRGEVNLDNIVDDGRYNLQGVKAVYAAKQVYEQQARVIRDYNRKRKAGLRNQADEYLKNAGSWKDKRAGILYSRETQERNVYDIVKNKAEAKALIAEYFAPVHRHESDAIKLKNELRDKVRELDLSRKVQKGNLVSEAHAVQLLGEAEDNIRMLQTNKRMKTRDGKTLQEWEAIVENLWKESPKLDQQKIRNGVQAFREMYDDLFRRMNEVRVRNGYEPINFRSGYFPHFQAEADGILAAFGKAMGINTAVEALPTSINGLTRNFKPGIRWVGNTLERLGFDTTYDAVEGFDRYIEGVADVIYHTDDIQKLRALSAQVRYRTTDEGIRERVDQVRADGTLTDQDKETLINSIYANGRFELGNYAVNLDEYTNLLANKKSESDRNMERQVGRHMYKLTKTLEGRVAANMVAVNPASWMTNFIPITQGGAQLGPTQLLHGMWNTLVSMKTDDGVVGRSSFLTNRQGSDSLVLSRGQTWSATASAPMGWIDNFTAGSLVRARYEQNLKRGLSEQAALEEADEWAAGVMADRSKGSMPTLFHASNPLTKLFTQFQLEVNNQLSYLFKDIPREELEKGIGHLIKAYLKFFVFGWLYNEAYEYFLGRRPALDPIGILDEFSGDLTGWEIPNMVELGVGAVKDDLPEFRHEKAGTYEAVTGLLGNVAEELPFVGGLLGGGRVPIQSALPDVENLGKVIFSDDWSREKKWATAGKELLKPAAYLAPPFGGGQLKKAIEGINAWWNNGSYTVNAKGEQQLQYPIFNDTLVQSAANLAKVITFGKTTLKTGQEWIENDFKTFSVNETAAYNAMVETGLQGEEAYNLLLNLRATQKTETESAEKRKQRALLESDVPADAKAAVYYAMFATDDERVLLDTIIAVGDNGGAAAETLIQMKMQEKSNGKREVLMDAGLTDWEKRQIYREKISDTRDDDIELFRKAGMDMDDFLEVQNKYTEINSTEGAKAGDKALALSRWLNGRNYSAEQKETIKEVFKFFSQIPAEAEKYDSFTAMGMSDDEAFRLTDELSALQPEEGKKQVSNLQKWQTVVGAGLSKDKQLAALEEVMSETEYLKLNIGNGYGIDPQTYVKFKAALQTHDANGNGSYSQDEIRAAIDGMSGADEEAAFMAMLLGESVDAVFLTTEQKAVLWQLQSSSDSAKNNPYSKSVGEKVLQLKKAEDSPVAESEAALLAMLGLN